MLGRRRSDVVGGAREAAVVVRAADRRRGEDGLCGNQPSCGAPEIDFHTASDRELRDAPVVVRVPVVVAEMFVVVGPSILGRLRRSREAIALYRKTLPVVARVHGESDQLTLIMMNNYGGALYEDPRATLDDFREAVNTLEETERTARRVLGGAHPLMLSLESNLREAQAALRSREAGKKVVFVKK